MSTNTTKLTLKAIGTQRQVASATVTYEVAGGATIDAQVQTLIGADLHLPDGEYEVYDEQTRHPGADYVIASSAGVISAAWREPTPVSGQWDGLPADARFIERD